MNVILVPRADEPPCAFSSNWTSLTMIPLSQTVPHLVHTLSALELSLSISAEPQFWHLSAGILTILSLIQNTRLNVADSILCKCENSVRVKCDSNAPRLHGSITGSAVSCLLYLAGQSLSSQYMQQCHSKL